MITWRNELASESFTFPENGWSILQMPPVYENTLFILLFIILLFKVFYIYLWLHIYLIYDEYSLSHCLSALCCSILTAYYILNAFFKYKCMIIKYLIQTCLCLKKIINLWFHCKKTILLYHHYHHHYISSHSVPTWCNA